jgi:hypothetical protein
VARLANDQISAGLVEHKDEFRVTSGPGSTWTPANGVPKVHAEWWGYAVKACVLTQSDIFYHVESSVTFSLPQPNSLQTDAHVDWHANEWDIFWCALVSGLIGGVVFALIGSVFGPVGAGVGAGIGLVGGFVAALVIAESYTPDFGQANCVQQGHDLTCQMTLSDQVRTAGPGLVLNITEIAGPSEGLLLSATCR